MFVTTVYYEKLLWYINVIFGNQVFTSVIILCALLACVDTSDWEFPDVCQYYFGKVGQWSSLMFSMVSLVGAMVVYWVLMSNFLFNTGQFIYSKKQWFYLQKSGIMSFYTIVWHVNLCLCYHMCSTVTSETF